MIVTRGSTATNIAKKTTASVPIVMIAGLDPVKSGFAASLSRWAITADGNAASALAATKKRRR